MRTVNVLQLLEGERGSWVVEYAPYERGGAGAIAAKPYEDRLKAVRDHLWLAHPEMPRPTPEDYEKIFTVPGFAEHGWAFNDVVAVSRSVAVSLLVDTGRIRVGAERTNKDGSTEGIGRDILIEGAEDTDDALRAAIDTSFELATRA